MGARATSAIRVPVAQPDTAAQPDTVAQPDTAGRGDDDEPGRPLKWVIEPQDWMPSLRGDPAAN